MYTRRFLTDPGSTVLLEIESINILDLTPPGAITGVGSGTACIVGEFEDGPFNLPVAIESPTQLTRQFGQLGYQYGGLTSQNPCSRRRYADGALIPEYWNGNAFVQLNGKQFSALTVCRVNTSVGQVSFARLAFLTGAQSFTYGLVSGQVLQADTGSGQQSATFTGTVASVTGSAIGTGPFSIAAGSTLVLGYDAAPNFTVTFLASDVTTIAGVVARINATAGFTFATISGSGGSSAIELTGLVGGLSGQVRVVSGSSGVLTTLGLTAATTLGAGNVQNIAAVTASQINTIVSAAITNSQVQVDQNGNLRLVNTGSSGFLVIGAGTTAAALGFVAGQSSTATGLAVLTSSAESYPVTLAAGTITFQIDSYPAVVVTFASGSTTLATVVSTINAAFTAAGQPAPATSDGTSAFYLIGQSPGGSVSVVSASVTGNLTALGLQIGTTNGVLPPFGLLPAGTVVTAGGSTQWVTMQDLDFEQSGVSLLQQGSPGSVMFPATATSFQVPVRFALDDDSGVGTGAGTVTTVPTAPAIGAFSVVNLLPLSNALTESAIDAAYVTAIASTINPNLPQAQQINIIWSARQSNLVRQTLLNNAESASDNGCYGRMAVIRPPLGSTENTVFGAGAPGVNAYRDTDGRCVYCYPGANTTVPQIAALGIAGGEGFTVTGAVDVGADGFLVSIMSQLNPEENPGQTTNFTGYVNGLESSPNVQNFGINDYIAFKANGICALRIENGIAIFQSESTTVAPLLYPTAVNIKRRRMADYIQDSIAVAMQLFGKQLTTIKRQKAILTEINTFLNSLAGGGPNAQNGFPNDEDAQRIEAYAVVPGDESLLPEGLYRIVIAVQLLSSFDSIVLQTTIGETVNVQQIISANQNTSPAT